MRKITFFNIVLNNNIKLYVKGDQAYNCNLQLWIIIIPGSFFIMRFALCRTYITWHILHVLCIHNYISLWCVNCQMWQCQLHVKTSSVLIKYFPCYLISLGTTPAYDILPHNGSQSYSLKRGDIAQVIGVCDISFTGAYCSIILDFSHGVRTYICILVELCFPCIL